MFQQTMSERKAEKPFSFLNSFLYFFGFVSIFQFCCWTQCQLPILAPVTPSSAVMALLLLIQGDNHHHHHLHCHHHPLITWRISVIGGLSIIMLMIMIIHPACTTGYLEDIWEGWSQLWDQEPLGCWLDTSRYAWSWSWCMFAYIITHQNMRTMKIMRTVRMMITMITIKIMPLLSLDNFVKDLKQL